VVIDHVCRAESKCPVVVYPFRVAPQERVLGDMSESPPYPEKIIRWAILL
jgi:hypothetical protein